MKFRQFFAFFNDHCQWICCWPDVVGCGGAGTTSPGETIKRERVSVVTNVQLQLMFVHWW